MYFLHRLVSPVLTANYEIAKIIILYITQKKAEQFSIRLSTEFSSGATKTYVKEGLKNDILPRIRQIRQVFEDKNRNTTLPDTLSSRFVNRHPDGILRQDTSSGSNAKRDLKEANRRAATVALGIRIRTSFLCLITIRQRTERVDRVIIGYNERDQGCSLCFLSFSFFFFFLFQSASNIWWTSVARVHTRSYTRQRFTYRYVPAIVAITSPLMALHNVICRPAPFLSDLFASPALSLLFSQSTLLSLSPSSLLFRLSCLIFKHQSSHFLTREG